MEPFSKDDPLHHLLGKARPVEPRPNFTQNVMRQVRNTPQETLPSWLSTLVSWLGLNSQPRAIVVAVPALAALILTALVIFFWNQEQEDSMPSTVNVVQSPAATSDDSQDVFHPNVVAAGDRFSGDIDPSTSLPISLETESSEESLVASELDSIDHLSHLLSSQDTSSLTDGELAMLLY